MQEISLKVPAKHHGLCIPIFSLPMCVFRAGYKNCRKNFWSRLSASSTHPLTSIHLSRNAARKKCWILLVSYPTLRPLPSERPFNLQEGLSSRVCNMEFNSLRLAAFFFIFALFQRILTDAWGHWGFLLHITDVRNDHDSSEAILYRCTYIPILLFPKVEGLNYYAPNLLRYAQRRPTYVSTSFVPPDQRTSVPTEEGGNEIALKWRW